MRHTLSHRYNHLAPAFADGSRDGQGLLPESDRLVVVANGLALVRPGREHPREPGLVAELPCEPFRLVDVLSHTRPIAQRLERRPKGELRVAGLLRPRAGPRLPLARRP